VSGTAVDYSRLEPGFAEPVHNAQACFRAVLNAMAHPGHIERMPLTLAGAPPAPLGIAAAAIALTLCDFDTPVWLDPASRGAAPYLTFHCGAPLTDTPGEARFAFVADMVALPPLIEFALGTDEYPERSTTLVIEVARLTEGEGVELTGPGLREAVRLDVAGLPARFWTERAAVAELFPRGIDVMFVSGDRVAALPRSTRISLS
jgi:alpha-D-ribose 1-methylphosphonate 5-triphosphate synthase subunit PhnH